MLYGLKVTFIFRPMRNKLAYFCSSDSWGGLEMNHLRNAHWMKERGHEVIVLGIESSPIHTNAVAMELPFRAILPHRRWYDFKAIRRIMAIVETEKISHFIIRKVGDMSLAAGLKNALKEEIHVSYFMEMQLGIRKKSLFHTLRYRNIDVWSCPLHWLKNQVEAQTRFRNTLVVIPSGVELNQFNRPISKWEARKELNLPEDGMLFGIAGRLDRKKGQLLLLEAMVKCKSTQFSVLFVGQSTLNEGNEYFDRMNDFIRDNNLIDRVIFRPHNSKMTTFYSSIDWMVMASESETVGMVTIEALACGKPVLGSNSGGTPEIMNGSEGGVLFDTLDSDDLARKIDLILNTPVLKKPSELMALASKFDHEKVCAQVESALGLLATH